MHDRICCRRYHLHTVFSASCSRVLGITKVATHMTFVSPVCYQTQTPTFEETRLFRSYLLSESIINALCMRLKSFLSLRTVFALDGNTKPLNEWRKLPPELVDFLLETVDCFVFLFCSCCLSCPMHVVFVGTALFFFSFSFLLLFFSSARYGEEEMTFIPY